MDCLQVLLFTGYADDNTPLMVRENTTNSIKILLKLFSDNQLKLNTTEKCHVLLNSQWPNTTMIGNLRIKISSCKKILDINFAYKLKFTNHIDEICRKASRKLNSLARIAPHMGIRKWRTLMNAFFKSQFNYCPLIWMCCNRSLNNKLGRLHALFLRIVYNDKTSDFSELLGKDDNLQLKCSRNKSFISWNCKRIVSI